MALSGLCRESLLVIVLQVVLICSAQVSFSFFSCLSSTGGEKCHFPPFIRVFILRGPYKEPEMCAFERLIMFLILPGFKYTLFIRLFFAFLLLMNRNRNNVMHFVQIFCP